MVRKQKKDAKKVVKELSKVKKKEIMKIIKKIKSAKRAAYVRSQPEVEELLKRAFKEKKGVKINYYSLSSDEVRNRIIDIYQMHENCIVAYCHLRNDERTFVIDRINKATLLKEKYTIPKNWSPESIIFDSSSKT